jgi:hypothetical protein
MAPGMEAGYLGFIFPLFFLFFLYTLGHLVWRPTFLVLTADYLGFGKIGENTLTEYILLEEVLLLCC